MSLSKKLERGHVRVWEDGGYHFLNSTTKILKIREEQGLVSSYLKSICWVMPSAPYKIGDNARVETLEHATVNDLMTEILTRFGLGTYNLGFTFHTFEFVPSTNTLCMTFLESENVPIDYVFPFSFHEKDGTLIPINRDTYFSQQGNGLYYVENSSPFVIPRLMVMTELGMIHKIPPRMDVTNNFFWGTSRIDHDFVFVNQSYSQADSNIMSNYISNTCTLVNRVYLDLGINFVQSLDNCRALVYDWPAKYLS